MSINKVQGLNDAQYFSLGKRIMYNKRYSKNALIFLPLKLIYGFCYLLYMYKNICTKNMYKNQF